MDINTIREMIAGYNSRWPDTSENDVYLFVDEKHTILRYWESDDDVPNTNGIEAIISFLAPPKKTLADYSIKDLINAVNNYQRIHNVRAYMSVFGDGSGHMNNYLDKPLDGELSIEFIEKYK